MSDKFPMYVRRDCALSAGDNCCGHLDIALWCVEGGGCCWRWRRVQYSLSVFTAMLTVFILTGGGFGEWNIRIFSCQ